MIGLLKRLWAGLAAVPDSPPPDPDRLRLAMAALLVEAARADFHVREAELEELQRLLAAGLDLPAEQARELLGRARKIVENSVSLHEFTQPLHDSLTYRQKEDFVRMLWHVALADRRLDKYEDYLIGKVSELLYVARADVLRLRHEALQRQPASVGGA